MPKPATKQPVKKTVASKVPQPVYDLYRDGLTQGSIATFLDCREQFRLKYVFGYRAKSKSGATAFGSAFHDILSSIQHSASGKVLTLDEAVAKHYESLGGTNLVPAQAESISAMLATIRIMIQRYLERWAKDDAPKKWELREDTFNQRVTVEYGMVNEGSAGQPGCVIPLRGRFDGVFRDKAGGLWLHETKTKGRIDEDGIAAMLPHDTQTQLYCWAIRKRFGEAPKGVIYDVIRNPSIKQNQKETQPEFLARLDKDLQTRTDWYYMRWQVALTKKDLDTWEARFLYPVLSQIVAWWESIKENPHNPWTSPLHYVRPGAFWSVYGRADLFNALTSGNFFDLEQSKIIYPELID